MTAISSRRENMSHIFFNHSNSIAQHASMHYSFVPASYDLNIMPNAIRDGVLIEADHDGTIVAVKLPDGQTMRCNFRYIVHRTPTENLLIDINRIVHPLD